MILLHRILRKIYTSVSEPVHRV